MDSKEQIKTLVKNEDSSSLANLVYNQNKSNFEPVIIEALRQNKLELIQQLISFIELPEIKDIYLNLKDVNQSIKFLDICLAKNIVLDKQRILTIALESSDAKQLIYAIEYFESNRIELDFETKGIDYLKSALKSGNLKSIKLVYKKLLKAGVTTVFNNPEELIDSALCTETGFNWLSKMLEFNREDIGEYIDVKKLVKASCFTNSLTILKIVFEKWNDKIDIHYRYELYFRTACEHGSIDVAKYLYEKSVKNGSPIDIYSCNGYAFEKACWNNKLEVVKWLDSIGYKLNIEEGNHSVFENTFKNNNHEVAKWFTMRYPIYVMKKITTCGDSRCRLSGCQSSKLLFEINELNHLETLFKNNDKDGLINYLKIRGVIKIKRENYGMKEMKELIKDADDTKKDNDGGKFKHIEERPSCIICGDENDCFVNICDPKFEEHIYCLECLSKNYRINFIKECLICKQKYEDKDIKLVVVE